MNMGNKLLIIFVFLLFAGIASARAPAVEPITGISIDDQPKIPPSKAKYFDFRNEKPKVTVVKKSTEKGSAPSSGKVGAKEISPFYLIFLIIALPFFVRFVLMDDLKKHTGTEELDNVISLDERREKDISDDDYDIPKAS